MAYLITLPFAHLFQLDG